MQHLLKIGVLLLLMNLRKLVCNYLTFTPNEPYFLTSGSEVALHFLFWEILGYYHFKKGSLTRNFRLLVYLMMKKILAFLYTHQISTKWL